MEELGTKFRAILGACKAGCTEEELLDEFKCVLKFFYFCFSCQAKFR